MTANSPADAGNIDNPEVHSLDGRELSASLTVNDLEKSFTWYCYVLGFAVDEKYEREGKLVAASLRAGSARIVLGQDDGAKGFDRVKGEGFSLRITTDQDIDDLANRIKERGGVLASEPADVYGARTFRLLDPDGFRLVISSVR